MERIDELKTFLEVFPTLKIQEELQFLFQDVKIQKITTNSSREFLQIYMISHHLIPKRKVWQMEKCIKEQLFGTTNVWVRIEEKYVLSELYTLETILSEYRESLLLELEQRSMLAANMFEQAQLQIEEQNIVCLELVDSIVSEGKKEYIVELLEEVLEQRFGLVCEIRVQYREKEAGKNREYDEQKIMRFLKEGQSEKEKRFIKQRKKTSLQNKNKKEKNEWENLHAQSNKERILHFYMAGILRMSQLS